MTVGSPIRPAGTDWAAAVALREAVRAEILRGCGEPDLAAAAGEFGELPAGQSTS
jgi:hypothetical protein